MLGPPNTQMARPGPRTRALRCRGTQFVCERAQIDTVTLAAAPRGRKGQRKCSHPMPISSWHRPTPSGWRNIATLKCRGVGRGPTQPKRRRAGTAQLCANEGKRRWRRGCPGTWTIKSAFKVSGRAGRRLHHSGWAPRDREVRVRDSSQTHRISSEVGFRFKEERAMAPCILSSSFLFSCSC